MKAPLGSEDDHLHKVIHDNSITKSNDIRCDFNSDFTHSENQYDNKSIGFSEYAYKDEPVVNWNSMNGEEKVQSSSYRRISCKLCVNYFTQIKTLLKHYNESHNFNFMISKIHFTQLSDLNMFLEDKQKTSYHTLILTNSKNLSGFKYQYYKCNYKKNEARICPVFITSKSNHRNQIFVQYNLEHVHNADWIHVTVPPFYKNMLMKKLQMGIPVQTLYENIIKEFDELDIKRETLITRKYLHYLKGKVICDRRVFQDDSENTKYILKNEFANDIEFLIYKDVSEILDDSDLDKDDFIICFSTREMIKSFKMHGRKGVLFDSTHSTTRYGVLLITGLVMNENQRGEPFIFIITNSERTNLLTYCFENFKEKIGPCKTPAFLMSDCYNGFFNAWKNVFEDSVIHLWCIYHVDKSLYKNIIKYCRKESDRIVLQNLVTYILEIDSKSRFDQEYPEFMAKMKSTSERFYRYFVHTYDNNRQRWALYSRFNAPFSTNNLCESWFSMFKRVHLKNNTQNRIDLLIRKLLDITKHKCIENKRQKLLPVNSNKSYRQIISEGNHKDISTMEKSELMFLKENCYKYKDLLIEFKPGDCEHGCVEECQFCMICSHQATCTCVYFTKKKYICKHIHMVVFNIINVKKKDFQIKQKKLDIKNGDEP